MPSAHYPRGRPRGAALRAAGSTFVLNATFVTGRIHARRDAPAVLDLIAAGTLDVAPVTTRVVPFDDAADALAEHYTKLVFAR